MSGDTSGPVGQNVGFKFSGDEVAQERRRELRAAQMSAKSVRDGRPSKVPQLTPAPLARTSPSSAERPGEKCWPGFEQNSKYEHRKACYDSSAPIPELAHWQERQRQVGAEVLHFVVDVQTTDRHQYGRGGGQHREPMTTQQISTAQTASSAVWLLGSRSILSFIGAYRIPMIQ